jgi:hypothetical protein
MCSSLHDARGKRCGPVDWGFGVMSASKGIPLTSSPTVEDESGETRDAGASSHDICHHVCENCHLANHHNLLSRSSVSVANQSAQYCSAPLAVRKVNSAAAHSKLQPPSFSASDDGLFHASDSGAMLSG